MNLPLTMAVMVAGSSAWAADSLMVYFGTYTGAKSKGIYQARLDLATGRLSAPELAAETPSPSYLAIHPSKRFLYAVNEVNDYQGKSAGSVAAFTRDPATGKLTALNRESTQGAHPCHLTIDATGRWVLAANYSGGNLAVLPLDKDGRVGAASQVIPFTGSSVNPQRQKEPHAHSINLSLDNQFAVAADLGTDKLMLYQWDGKKGQLVPNTPPFVSLAPGSGPRHFAFTPERTMAFAINEMLSTLTAFRWDRGRGGLKELATLSTLPAGAKVDNTTAHVLVHPRLNVVYGSNRGHDSIAVFGYDSHAGKVHWIENESTQGKTPRNFGIDPTGRWLLAANQDSNSVVVFAIDQKTGELSPTGQSVEVGAPVCVLFVAPN